MEKLSVHGLWKAEGSAFAGLPISVGSLPSVAVTGVDKPCEGQEVLAIAWQSLCTPSPSTFLHNKSCQGEATVPDMVDSPVAYGTWKEREVVIRMPSGDRR